MRTLATSGPAPTVLRRARAADVFVILASVKAEEEMTRGTSGTVEMWWPRARRREGTEEAARAEAVAKRLKQVRIRCTQKRRKD